MLPGEFTIGDLNVRLDLNLIAGGSSLSELKITLIAPNGTRISARWLLSLLSPATRR